MAHHRIEAGPETVHWGYFDARLPPLLTVDSGDTVTISTVSGPPRDDAAAAARRARRRSRPCMRVHKPKLPGHICTGPVAVRGAKAGQVLEVRIKDDRAPLRLGLQLLGARSQARCRTTSPSRT